jgi:hypothetical protein
VNREFAPNNPTSPHVFLYPTWYTCCDTTVGSVKPQVTVTLHICTVSPTSLITQLFSSKLQYRNAFRQDYIHQTSAIHPDTVHESDIGRRASYIMENEYRDMLMQECFRMVQRDLTPCLASNDERFSALLSTLFPDATPSVDSSPSDTNNTTWGPQPSTLQILQMAIVGDPATRSELLHVARSIGDIEKVPEFSEELKRGFTAQNETALLAKLLSAENFQTFRDENAKTMGVHGASRHCDSGFQFGHVDAMTGKMDWESQAALTDLAPHVAYKYTPLSAFPSQSRKRAAIRPFKVSNKDLNQEAEPCIFTELEVCPLKHAPMVLHTRAPPAPAPKFDLFLSFPLELRARIYEEALFTGAPIRPHLCDCDPNGAIKFHDATQHSRLEPNHGAINALLGITTVSKQIRDESLPCFYAANTIAIGNDTATYFLHLQRLGRFRMLHHVRVDIPMYRTVHAAQTLQLMHVYRADVAALDAAHPRSEHRYPDVTAHPAYVTGGQNDLTTFVCLGMLASAFTSGAHVSRIVLPIPSVAMFDAYPHLRWFPAVCEGLGMRVTWVEGEPLSASRQGGVALTWYRKLQGAGKAVKREVDVKARLKKMFPDAEGLEDWTGYVYMRVGCDGETVRWFNSRAA